MLVQFIHANYMRLLRLTSCQGTENGTQAYHAHVLLKTAQPLKAKEAWMAKQRTLAIKLKPRPARVGDLPTPYNMTVVSADWTSSVGADKIMSDAVNSLPAIYMPEKWGKQGQTYTFPIRTTTDIGPAAVSQAFQTAIGNAMVGQAVAAPTVQLVSQHTILV
jgi:hypothetical protein